MDSQNAISYRNFASNMGDSRLLAKVDCYIQEHLLEISEQEDFLKLPRLKASPNSVLYFLKNVSWGDSVQHSLIEARKSWIH